MSGSRLSPGMRTLLRLQASEILFEAYGERFRPPALLKQRVRAGRVGGRGQKGWREKR